MMIQQDIYEEIGELENYGDDIDYKHKHYYIGLPHYDTLEKEYLLASCIRTESFFKYGFNSFYTYLMENSVLLTKPDLHIMQLQLPNNVDPTYAPYNVVLKTTWLKLIQRTWKKQYARRKEWWAKNKFDLTHLREQNNIIIRNPYSLKGMLSYLKVSK
jgi:hypothetical protein